MKIKRLLTITVVLALLLNCLTFAFASNYEDGIDFTEYVSKNAVSLAKSCDMESNSDYTVTGTHFLNKFGSEEGYTLVELSPRGFAIFDNYSGVLEELSLSEEMPYFFDDQNDNYFAGPMNYCVKQGEKIVDVRTGYKYTDDDIDFIKKLENKNKSSRSPFKGPVDPGQPNYTDVNMLSASYFINLTGDNDFGNNLNGTCTQLACAIMIGYYRYAVNPLFITNPNYLGTNNGTSDAFHVHLQSWMGSSGVNLITAKTGIESYLASLYFTTPVVTLSSYGFSYVYSKVVDKVTHDRPALISMSNSYNTSAPYNHTCVAYGYRIATLGSSTNIYYYVHTGLHDNPNEMWNYSWFYRALSID